MQMGACLKGAACGFASKPRAWWIGGVTNQDNLTLATSHWQSSWSVLASDRKASTDIIEGILKELSEKTRMIELAWRLGSPVSDISSGRRTILRLRHGLSGADSADMGNCETLSLGEVHVQDFHWQLTTECNVSQDQLPDDAFRTIAGQASESFRWKLTPNGVATAELKGKETINFYLFPYEMAKYQGDDGAARRGPVPTPSTTNQFLVSLAVELKLPPADLGDTDHLPKNGGKGTETSRLTFWASLVYIALLLSLTYLIRKFYLLFKEYNTNSNFLNASSVTSNLRDTMSPPAGHPNAKRRFWHRLRGSKQINSENENAITTPEAAAAPLARTVTDPTGTGTSGNRHDNDLRDDRAVAVELIQTARSEMETNFESRISKLDEKVSGSQGTIVQLTNEQNRIKEIVAASQRHSGKGQDVSGQLMNLTERVKKGETRWEGLPEMIQKIVAITVSKELQSWNSALLFPEDSPKLATPELISDDGPPPKIDPRSVGILEPAYYLSCFALDILRAWHRLSPFPVRGLESDPIGESAVSSFKAMQAVAYCDRLLWAWFLGRVRQSSQVTNMVRVAKKKWALPPTNEPLTKEEAARLALQWADERMPHLQTLIEATPFEFGSSTTMRLGEALVTAAEPFLGSTQPLETSISALSENFHALVKCVYNAADAQYIPVRLYSDSIKSSDIPTFIADTKAAYGFSYSGTLIERKVAESHGLIVRVNQPISKRRDRTSGQSRWEGSLSYLEVRTK